MGVFKALWYIDSMTVTPSKRETKTAWQKVLEGSGRPWLKTFVSGSICWMEDETLTMTKLNSAVYADRDKIILKPNDDKVFDLSWKNVLLVSPFRMNEPGLFTLVVEHFARVNDSSQLHAITNLVANGGCGPALAHSFQNHAERMDLQKFSRDARQEGKLQRMRFSFERETDATLFAAYIVALSTDDKSFRIVDADE